MDWLIVSLLDVLVVSLLGRVVVRLQYELVCFSLHC